MARTAPNQESMMERSEERRSGTDRRRRAEVFFPWQELDWAPGWDGRERRSGERRSGADRRRPVTAGHQATWYSEDWVRARGARDLRDWLDRCAARAPVGLPEGWHPAA